MKAIEQVIRHLRARGALSHSQFAYLQREGFWDRDEDDPYHEAGGAGSSDPAVEGTAPPEPVADVESEWDRAIQRSLVAARKRGRNSHAGQGSLTARRRPAGGDAAARALCEQIAERRPGWHARLDGLWEIARRCGGVAGPADGPAVIQNAAPGAMDRAVGEALEASHPGLGDLWRALDLEDYRAIGPADAGSKAVLTCYRMVIGGAEHADLGRYAWLLKEPEVRWVYQLVHAQRRVLAAIGRLFATERPLLARHLRRLDADGESGAFLAFVLLYNARRFDPARPPMRTLAVSGPPVSPQEKLRRAFSGSPVCDEIAGVSFSPDGRLVAGAVAWDRTLRAWDAGTGRVAFEVGLEAEATAVAWSHQGRQLAAADATGRVHVLDLGSRRVARAELGRATARLAFSADGAALFFSLSDGVGKLTLGDGRWARLPGINVASCDGLAASADGRMLAVGGSSILGLYDIAADRLRALPTPSEWVNGLALSPDGTRLASAGGTDYRVSIHEVRSGEVVHLLAGHEDEVTAVGYDSSGTILATASRDGTLRRWDARDGAPLGVVAREDCSLRSVAVGRRGALVASATERVMRLWDAGRLRPGPGEHCSPRPLPDRPGWLRAWSQALVMDPGTATPFLAYYFSHWPRADDGWRLTYRDLGLVSPREWDR